ncbi:DEAD/DEAH box helicase [Lichenicoccus sp.]|uniref:DEAD/DEAH box helicase n=1 Tax=Lichenicoccus sp. TaxID=2781899 RepID=UPI003D11E7D9
MSPTRSALRRQTEPDRLSLFDQPGFADGRDFRVGQVRAALAQRSGQSGEIAAEALLSWPHDAELLLLAALAELAHELPDRAQALLKRFAKGYGAANKAAALLAALALGQQGKHTQAWMLLEANGLRTDTVAISWFVGDDIMEHWLCTQLRAIRQCHVRSLPRARKPPVIKAPKPRAARPAAHPAAPVLPPVADLPRLEAQFAITVELANRDAIAIAGSDADNDPAPFYLRGELVRLSLFEGFDELLCLSALQGVEAHWYQVETVRRVLKQYRGRVLLADEVGLGKTVEAGMVLKEYILRGMAERILILTPASLVGQWRDEMAEKFGIACATSHDPLFREDPAAFWAQPVVIASIASARRKEHAELLADMSYDVLVVDEAHHLRDQSSASWRLVNRLQKRFLLLLSATPVQNSLLELYNLLTLLQPGIFKTQKEFRSVYMVAGKPREPANRERLRDLMRGVMVRNTRALAALRMPRRHASTLRAAPDPIEAECYAALTTLVREASADGQEQHRLSLAHLLSAAGSSPTAAAAAVARFIARHPASEPATRARWDDLLSRLRALGAGAKEAALLRLLAQNPTEKKLVFVHQRDSLTHLAERLRQCCIAFAQFSGDMSGPQKDAAVDSFRDHLPVLLCSESGGEGRNLQFCNTLINFDIPWNPMAIEQRIGRIDRIGQTREVFVFNLVTSGTIEDAVLRILDEKINMFELVVGEVGAILGEVDEQQDFSTLVLQAWLHTTEQARTDAFTQIENQLLAARRQYDDVKQFDEALFGNDLDAA